MAKKNKTPKVTYDSIYNDLYKKGKSGLKEQISANDTATDNYVTGVKNIYSDTADQLTQKANRSKSELNQDYQRDYDLNAVSQLVAERQLREKIANAGLGASGYNLTQQTALAINRMNADRAVTRQKTAARDTIDQNLQDAITANSSEMQAKITAAIKENEEKNAALKTAFENAVSENATSQYNNYVTNQTNSAIAAQESADNRYKAKLDSDTQLGVATIKAGSDEKIAKANNTSKERIATTNANAKTAVAGTNAAAKQATANNDFLKIVADLAQDMVDNGKADSYEEAINNIYEIFGV